MMFVFFLFGFLSSAFADFSSQGEVAIEYRQFEKDNSSTTEDQGVSFFSRLESRYEFEDYSHVFRGFARVDSEESSRDIIWVEDAYFSYFLDEYKEWRFGAGYKIYNWTALEAFRPADVLNSRNYDAPYEKPEKRGEAAIELEMPFHEGAFTLYYFPRVESPHYPGERSRLGAGITPAKAVWVDELSLKDEQWQSQYGFRLTQFLWGADLAIHYLNRYDRQMPLFGTTNYVNVGGNNVPVNGVASMNVPHFYRMIQYGATLQMPFFDAFVFKAEGVSRTFEDELLVLTAAGLRRPLDHQEVAFGLEYATTHADGSESTFFFETVQIIGVTKEERALMGAFQSDVFLGLRHARNDIMGTEFLATVILDTERTHEKLYNLQVSRRLSDVWKASGSVRVFDAPKDGTIPVGLEPLDGDNHLSLTLTRFF